VKLFQGGKYQAIGPAHTPQQRQRMIQRHRAQLKELLTNYGPIDMICLDQWMAGDIWPEMRKTMLELRKIQPDVMYRARGIGNYGDYYTAEGFIPGGKEDTNMPWFVTQGLSFLPSYDAVAANYKNAQWIIHSLIDSVSKGGNFMICIGPDRDGLFHPKGIEAIEEAGAWLKINGHAIYATRARDGALWHEGDKIHFTRTKDRKWVYALCLQWPGKLLRLETVKAKPGSAIRLLGLDKSLVWRDDNGMLLIDLPEALQEEKNRPGKHAWVFQIESSM
jgi:alpha-L-fucosidase